MARSIVVLVDRSVVPTLEPGYVELVKITVTKCKWGLQYADEAHQQQGA